MKKIIKLTIVDSLCFISINVNAESCSSLKIDANNIPPINDTIVKVFDELTSGDLNEDEPGRRLSTEAAGYGLLMWTNSFKDELDVYCKNKKLDEKKIDTQIQFFFYALYHIAYYKGVWNQKDYLLKSGKSIEEYLYYYFAHADYCHLDEFSDKNKISSYSPDNSHVEKANACPNKASSDDTSFSSSSQNSQDNQDGSMGSHIISQQEYVDCKALLGSHFILI